MPIAEPSLNRREGWSLIDAFLLDQRRPTAVEDFAQRHAEAREALPTAYYRDLIPLDAPRPGEQYAFEVDLDACSGCKACVAACHNMNGLEESETWREVGLLQGGDGAAAALLHVTTACHHCLEPACLKGCPVGAYEKDPLTGIVRHLDDQCFGCQYCILQCPYDAPKYSRAKGIVRKCDMCRDRLTAGEAPACVQGCPNHAIRIVAVNRRRVVEESEANQFLAGAPEPQRTLPTTVYKSRRPAPRNLLPADYYAVRPQHAHWPLVWMLVLTQLSVGGFFVEQLLELGVFGAGRALLPAIRPVLLVAALALGLTGMTASVFHLGRPRYAFRAVLGLRASWLSREIVGFGLFAACATAYTGSAWLARFGAAPLAWQRGLGLAASGVGLLAVFCSVMIYVDTRRPFWNATATTFKFYATALVLGLPTALGASLLAALLVEGLSARAVVAAFGRPMCLALVACAALKLLCEASVLRHLRSRHHTPLKRTAILMTGELARVAVGRFALGFAGGVVLPALLWRALAAGDLAALQRGGLLVGVAVSLAMLLVGELMERYLFFTAVAAPKMPGAPA